MEKNWLIRTKKLKILGPVSRKKIIELIENKSLKADDEICSGNGFWFLIKERQYMQQHLYDEEEQLFDPISEAKDTMESDNSPSINDCMNFPVKGNIVADAAKQMLVDHFRKEEVEEERDDITQITNLEDFLKSEKAGDLEEKEDVALPSENIVITKDEDSHEEVSYPDAINLEFPDIPQVTKGHELDVSLSMPDIQTENNEEDKDTDPTLSTMKVEEKLSSGSNNIEDDEEILYPLMDDLELPDEILVIPEQEPSVLVQEKSSKTEEIKKKSTKNKKVKKKKKRKVKSSDERRKATPSKVSLKKILFILLAVVFIIYLLQYVGIVQGQELKPHLDEKKKIFSFRPIIKDDIVISATIKLTGFKLDRTDEKIEIECERIDDFHYQLKLILNNQFKAWMSKTNLNEVCPTINRLILAKLNILKNKKNRLLDLKKYLQKNRFNKQKIDRIIRMYNSKIKLRNNKKYIKSFIKFVNIAFENKSKPSLNRYAVDMIKKYPDSMIATYLKILTYWQVDNIAMVKKVVMDFIVKSPYQFIFANKINTILTNKEREEYYSSIIKLLKLIEVKMINSMEYKLLLNYLSIIEDTVDIYSLKNNNNGRWSIPEVWKKTKSINYGMKYFGLWGGILLSYDQNLASEYIYGEININTVKKLDYNSLWIFSIFEIDEIQICKILSEKIIKKILPSPSKINRYTLLELLKNSVIREMVIAKKKEMMIPLFQMKHRFLNDLLKNGNSGEFGIYGLISQNDLNDDYLWWMIL